MKKITRDIQHYFTLFTIFGFGIIAFLVYSFDRNFQIAIIFALSAAYTTWGVVHHKIHRDLNLSVFLEYLSMSALGAIIIISLVINA